MRFSHEFQRRAWWNAGKWLARQLWLLALFWLLVFNTYATYKNEARIYEIEKVHMAPERGGEGE